MLEEFSVLAFKIPSGGSSADLCGIPHTGFVAMQAHSKLVSRSSQPPLESVFFTSGSIK